MAHVFEFWINCFWITLFSLVFNNYSFLRLLFITELIWGIFFLLTILLGIDLGNLCLVSFGFFILVFAALEFIAGVVLVIFVKEFTNSFCTLESASQITRPNLSSRWKFFFFNNFKF